MRSGSSHGLAFLEAFCLFSTKPEANFSYDVPESTRHFGLRNTPPPFPLYYNEIREEYNQKEEIGILYIR